MPAAIQRYLRRDTECLQLTITFQLDVYPAEIVGIIGESGCGKSTLLKSVLSLNNDTVRPLSGEILFRGQDVLQYGAADLRSISGREIAVIFQSLSMAFDPITKIGKQFFEAVKYHRKTANKKETDEKAAMLLRELKFDDPKRILNAYPFELSGGMVQRAAIVAAMLNEPALILADEATSALDAVSQEQVIETLLHIREKYATGGSFHHAQYACGGKTGGYGRGHVRWQNRGKRKGRGTF